MALIVEDGTGLSDAESFLSVADADSYFSKHGEPSAWTAATTAAKEAALRLATQYLCTVYHQRWKSVRTYEEQALDWPRAWMDDDDGYSIDSDELPQRLKDATAEMSLRSLSATLLPDVDNPGAIKRERVKVGPIEDEVEYTSGGKSQLIRYRLVDLLLAPYIQPSSRLERA